MTLSPAYIVEGQMEQRFIQNICPGKPVRLLNCNGDGVAISAIAARIKLHVNLLKGCRPIIVIFDRERRAETCECLERDLYENLQAIGVEISDVIIGIADRTAENWILADPNCFVDESVKPIDPKLCEGVFGKKVMKKLFRDSKVYGETTTGVRLLKKMNPAIVASNSASFRRLVTQIPFRCWWTAPLHE